MTNTPARRGKLSFLVLLPMLIVPGLFQETSAQAIKVELKTENGKVVLLRDGKPYRIQGAGGTASLSQLAECGGNSTRTWGIEETTLARLDEAHQNGISVALGVWLQHERHGFDYSNADAVARQADDTVEAIRKFKDHPAVLVWGIGNEMEGYEGGDNPNVWNHVENICKRIKEVDPNHPTMSVIAELGPDDNKIKAIHKLCPSLDIVGINSYRKASSLPERYRANGGSKPYIVTEFGPFGTWEIEKNEIEAIEEPSAIEKCKMYRESCEALSRDNELCLGTYAFLWGNKQEGTSTWFGLLMPDGKKLPTVDTMTELWSGSKPKDLCPIIEQFEVVGSNQVKANEVVQFKLKAVDPEGQPVNVSWKFTEEATNFITGGDPQAPPPDYSYLIKRLGSGEAVVRAPKLDGLYRMYVFVDDGANANVANIPIRVGELESKAELPFVLYDEPEDGDVYHPTGWMGDASAISMDASCRDNPKVGQHCIECEYKKTAGWGGVVWQNPDNDWGDRPGGLDLSGATKLTFWARGESGGEEVRFGFGLIGKEKQYFDTGKSEKLVQLTKQWKQVTIDIAGQDLQRIKSGFYWTCAVSDKPIRFYIDSIRYEK